MATRLIMLPLAGCMLLQATGNGMVALLDSTVLVQLQAWPDSPAMAQLKQMFSKDSPVKMGMTFGRQDVKSAVIQKTPLGLGKLIVNKSHEVHQCSDISSSHLCGMSQKVYGLACMGWGGQSCLKSSASCADITVAGICDNAKSRVNMTCLGWGGQSCLEHGADASMILDEHICAKSKGTLGISSVGWGGASCLTRETATCERLKLERICEDAGSLGLDCLGWSGSVCLSRTDARCSQITDRHICEQSYARFSLKCTWHAQGCVHE